MTDKKIIKALEFCSSNEVGLCHICPLYGECNGDITILLKYALDLINKNIHQQERIEELTERLNATIAGQETLQKALAEKDREIERLTAEKEQLIKTFGECQERAIKDFAKAVVDGLMDGRISRMFDMVDFTTDYLRGKMAGDTE